MTLSIGILVAIVILLVVIIQGLRGLQKHINDSIDRFTQKATESSSLAIDIGTAVAGSVIKKAKQALQPSDKDN
jgi:hypothetical protein